MTMGRVVCIVLLFLAIFSAVDAQSKVIRAYLRTIEERDIVAGWNVDVWSHDGSLIVGYNDIRLKSEQISAFERLSIPVEILVDDMQQMLDQMQTNHTKNKRASKPFFNDYQDISVINSFLYDLTTTYPTIIKRVAVGTSLGGYTIYAYVVTGSNTGTKKKVLFTGGIHAREWISPASVIYLIDKLVGEYNTLPYTTIPRLSQIEYHVIPQINPDGYAFSRAVNDDDHRWWRKNRRVNSDGSIGVDLNRNWDDHFCLWGSNITTWENYCGPYAFSEPETSSVHNYMETYAPWEGYIDFHSYSQSVYRQYGWTYYFPPDAVLQKEVGDRMAASVCSTTGVCYRSLVSYDLYPTGGTIDDYVYGRFGTKLTYCIELPPGNWPGTGVVGFHLPASQIEPVGLQVYIFVEILVGSLVSTPFSTPTVPMANFSCPSTQIKVNGACVSWSAGVNMLFMNYGRDFGVAFPTTGSGIPMGVSTSNDAKTKMEFFSSQGVKIVRWHLLADLRGGVKFDTNGLPNYFDPWFYTDMDKAIELAAQNNIQIVFVLFDYMMASKAAVSNNIKTGGRADLIVDPTKRLALINFIEQVMWRYALNKTIMAWEIMNEPEWVVSGIDSTAVDTTKYDPIPRAAFWDFASTIATLVHSTTIHQVTIGSYSLKYSRAWSPSYARQYSLPIVNLDFYSAHYYYEISYSPACYTNDINFGTVCNDAGAQPVNQMPWLEGKPIVISEMRADSLFGYNVAPLLDKLLGNGFSGGWPRTREIDTIYWPTVNAWLAAHTQNVLSIPSSVTGNTINSPYYTYGCGDTSSKRGDRYYIRGNGRDIIVSTCPNTGFDNYLYISSISGCIYNDDFSNCGMNGAYIKFRSVANQLYTVILSGYYINTGPYTLTITENMASVPSNQVGDTTNSPFYTTCISSSRKADPYVIKGTGRDVAVTTCPNAGGSAGFDTYILVNPMNDPGTCSINDDACVRNSKLVFPTILNELYVVTITGYSTYYGAYNLSILDARHYLYANVPQNSWYTWAEPAVTTADNQLYLGVNCFKADLKPGNLNDYFMILKSATMSNTWTYLQFSAAASSSIPVNINFYSLPGPVPAQATLTQAWATYTFQFSNMLQAGVTSFSIPRLMFLTSLTAPTTVYLSNVFLGV